MKNGIRAHLVRLALAASLAGPAISTSARAQEVTRTLATDFAEFIRPLLERRCLECHSTAQQKGELDLERFRSFEYAQKEPLVWQAVAEQIAAREMPPAKAPQLDEAERRMLAEWAHATLQELALANAGDPGPVVLRRLSNAEYTYTVRDLTGIEALDPAREFPVDGAAGEGFTNVGNALVMSPMLLAKYMDAAKGIAEHALLLPDGFRFSEHTTRRDQTEELIAAIRSFYRAYTAPGGGAVVDLQGIVFATNEGGRLPLERYLAATLALRDVDAGPDVIGACARERGLSQKYLGTLLDALRSRAPSLLLDPLRAEWRRCTPEDLPRLAGRIAAWQALLWTFRSVGHIGKVGGPTAWQEAVLPCASSQELRLKVPVPQPARDEMLTLYLVADACDAASDGAEVVWQRPRFVAEGRPELLLRDVRALAHARIAARRRCIEEVRASLAAAAEALANHGLPNLEELARRHGVDPRSLRAWFLCLGLAAHDAPQGSAYFTTPLPPPIQHAGVTGWGSPDTPLVVANSSEADLEIPGRLKAHGIVVHPSPAQRVVAGWRSPIDGQVRVAARIQDAHLDCGNGIAWSLELRGASMRRVLASGATRGGAVEAPPPIELLAVRRDEIVALVVTAGGRDHTCDLTAVDLEVTNANDGAEVWDLAADCSSYLLAANPHADRQGHSGVWHFFAEANPHETQPTDAVPAGSLLARWQASGDPAERERLCGELQRMLLTGSSATDESPDGALYRLLSSLQGPLVTAAELPEHFVPLDEADLLRYGEIGLDPEDFGGELGDAASLRLRIPSVAAVRVPAELVLGAELVATGRLASGSTSSGLVRMRLLAEPRTPERFAEAAPFVASEDEATRARVAEACRELRELFPAALCYEKIVPVDEVVTLTQLYREDEHLVRLMLDGEEQARLDRLWRELVYVSQEPLTQVDVFEQLWQFATQDADPSVFEPLRAPIAARAAEFREELRASEPRHLEALRELAARAYRRSLTVEESAGLGSLYAKLREEGLGHEAAIRLGIARVLVSPCFLYRLEEPGPGIAAQPVSDLELASRLSYFLWSSAPDEALKRSALDGQLRDPETLVAHARRMLRDPKVRRLAIEFGCAWLHVRGFDEVAEKSETHFPTFAALRASMYEETVLFLTDLFQGGGSLLDLVGADHTYLDGALAAHYGIPGVEGVAWRRVDGVQRYGRGGVLAHATALATQSGASRTSPILRGNWTSEVLLGETLPRPPKDVPILPADEALASLSMREITERHSRDPQCARCHERIDAFGFALEAYDAIGRRREHDLAGRRVDVRARTRDGVELDGLDGLRAYVLGARRDAFLRQFAKKLLGYALGRAVQLSDEPLLREMLEHAEAGGFRFEFLVEKIVQSRQFTHIRGRLAVEDR